MLTENLKPLEVHIGKTITKIHRRTFDIEFTFNENEVIKIVVNDQLYADNIRLKLIPDETEVTEDIISVEGEVIKMRMSEPPKVDINKFLNSVLESIEVVSNVLMFNTGNGTLRFATYNDFTSYYDVLNLSVISNSPEIINEEIKTIEESITSN